LLEAVGRASPFTRTYLLEAHPVSLDKNVLTIGFDPEFEGHRAMADTARTHSLLQTKLGELGHPNVQCRFIQAEAPACPAPPSPEPPPAPKTRAGAPAAAAAPAKEKPASVTMSQEDFKNDPLIRKALEIFKGQIVEVRG
jgi:DNA polymerase-3 subunit gamma/tau